MDRVWLWLGLALVAGVALHLWLRSPPSEAQLMKQLASNDHQARKIARDRITALGPKLVPVLIEAARAPSEQLRWEAVNLLGAIGDKRAAAVVLERVLMDDDVHVRWRSIWALTNLDDGTVVPQLLRALSDTNPTIVRNAAVALSLFGRQEAVPELQTNGLRDQGFRLWEAINALGKVHDEKTIPALLPFLTHSEPDIRRETALALGQIHDPRAVEPLIEALKDPDAEVRWRVALALGQLGDAKAIPALKQRLSVESDPTAQDFIREALRQLGATN